MMLFPRTKTFPVEPFHFFQWVMKTNEGGRFAYYRQEKGGAEVEVDNPSEIINVQCTHENARLKDVGFFGSSRRK